MNNNFSTITTRLDKWEDLWQDSSNKHLTGYSLYVSNLPSSVTARELKKIFETV